MELTKEELARALKLQRRLKLLRQWDRLGKFFCYPWTFYKETQKRWLEELTVLHHKKFCKKAAEDFLREHGGNPAFKAAPDEKAAKAAQKEFDEIMDLLRTGRRGG